MRVGLPGFSDWSCVASRGFILAAVGAVEAVEVVFIVFFVCEDDAFGFGFWVVGFDPGSFVGGTNFWRGVHNFYNFFDGEWYLLYFEDVGLHDMNSDVFAEFVDVLWGVFHQFLQIAVQFIALGHKLFNAVNWNAGTGGGVLVFIDVFEPIVLFHQRINILVDASLVNDNIFTLLHQLEFFPLYHGVILLKRRSYLFLEGLYEGGFHRCADVVAAVGQQKFLNWVLYHFETIFELGQVGFCCRHLLDEVVVAMVSEQSTMRTDFQVFAGLADQLQGTIVQGTTFG